MRDRIVFFILGAVLATVAYFAGDMDKAGAQDGLKILNGDVLINGQLIVAGGMINVQDNLQLKTPIDQVKGVVSITADSKGGTIKIFNGTRDKVTGHYPSNLTITAQTMAAGNPVSTVALFSEYDTNRCAVWARAELNGSLFKDLE